MKKVRSVDAAGGSMVVEAGVTLLDAQNAAADAGKLFPLSLASEGSATIGGALATNAGGTAVLAYGNARSLTLGLEAVLADGRVWHGLRSLKKDNTGYDLRDLLIGSEGTLAVVTAACLKLFPMPVERETAIVALPSPEAALDLFRLAEAYAGQTLTAFEFWEKRALEFALKYMPGLRDPFPEAHPWYALLELSHTTHSFGPARAIETLLTDATEKTIVRDAVIAGSLKQAQDFWRLRDAFSEAQKGAGGSIKHDVSVPIARIPEFLVRAADVIERVCPGARPVPFGHFGDGNLHYNVSQPEGMDKSEYLALWTPMSDAIFELIADVGGSISAEHGIGQMKREALRQYRSSVELDMMRAIKNALDPKGIMNPGKLL
jgi:FAD/FMN-containing dehydrogenase